MIHENVISAIGNTPLIRLNRVVDDLKTEIIAKCEFTNPGGSVKDRIGIAMIEDAEKKGLLKPGGTVVEGTSGNTGVGLAIAAAVKGYKCIFVMPDKMSQEKIRNLRAFGAKVVITPTAVEPHDPRSYYMVSRRLGTETPNAIYLNQYDNLSNRECHYRTTGPELYKQTNGEFDAFVAGIGTGGTITGTAMYLKEKKPSIQIVGVDPIGSILHDYFKTGKMTQAHTYKIEGIGEDIIPKNFDFKFIDEIVQVNDKESFQMTRRLLTQEGIFSGISAGSAVCGAIRYAKQNPKIKRIIVLIPDSGNRYLSKVYDDDWMQENGFLEEGLGTVQDLLDQVSAANASRGRVLTVNATDKVETVVRLMEDKGISQVPVLKDGQIEGIVSEQSILNRLFSGKTKPSDTVASVVENSFIIVRASDPVERLTQSISAGQTPLVLDGNQVSAIITKIDLISFLSARKNS